MANEIQNAFEKLTNQARFIQMIVEKQLVVSNRKKADIIADLRKHKFRPFPKVSNAKTAEETEDDAEDEERDDEPSRGADFDYLLGMTIWSLTKEKIEKLRQQATEKERELLVLLEKSPKDMWNTDLDQFLKAWEVCMQFHRMIIQKVDIAPLIIGRLCRVCACSRSRWQGQEGQAKASRVANAEIYRSQTRFRRR